MNENWSDLVARQNAYKLVIWDAHESLPISTVWDAESYTVWDLEVTKFDGGITTWDVGILSKPGAKTVWVE